MSVPPSHVQFPKEFGTCRYLGIINSAIISLFLGNYLTCFDVRRTLPWRSHDTHSPISTTIPQTLGLITWCGERLWGTHLCSNMDCTPPQFCSLKLSVNTRTSSKKIHFQNSFLICNKSILKFTKASTRWPGACSHSYFKTEKPFSESASYAFFMEMISVEQGKLGLIRPNKLMQSEAETQRLQDWNPSRPSVDRCPLNLFVIC